MPGMPNLHSHAFQRAMAGLTEYRANPTDSFWSWRELMYRFAARITPDMLGAIARWLYVEMLKAGYTSVCEFHYVHHARDGGPTLASGRTRAARRGCRQRDRHRHDDAAGALPVQRLRRTTAARRPAPLHQRDRRLSGAARHLARRPSGTRRAALWNRAALAARGIGGFIASRAGRARRDVARRAGAYPCCGADGGSRCLRRGARRTPRAMAARAFRCRRALVPRACDARRRTRNARTREERRDRGPVSDDRGKSRRRLVPRERLPRCGRCVRRRLG